MKKIIIIGMVIILAIFLIGGSYKSLIYKIFNDYEEVCVRYKMNAITTYQFVGEFNWGGRWMNDTEYIQTDVCIEYCLSRNLFNPNNDSCYFNRTYIDKSWKIIE